MAVASATATVAEQFLDIADGRHSVDQRWLNDEPFLLVWELTEKHAVGRHRFESIPTTVPVRFMVGHMLVREIL